MNDNIIQAQGGRWYNADGVWVPSVTSILAVYPKGIGFDKWLGSSDSYDDAIAKRDAAGERGTLVHEAIAALIAGQKIQIIPPPGQHESLGNRLTPITTIYAKDAEKVGKLVQGWVNWWESAKPDAIGCEVFVKGDGYAGTLDFYGWIDGEPWVVDWKSSAGVYTSYHLQTAAYAAALPETRYMRGVLHLKTSTKRGWQLVESEHSQEEDYATFLACKAIFHHEFGYEPIIREEKEKVQTVFKLSEVTK